MTDREGEPTVTGLTMDQVQEAARNGGWQVIVDTGNGLSVGRGRTTMQVSFRGDGTFIHASFTVGLDGMAQVVIEPMVTAELLAASGEQPGPRSTP